MRMNSMIQYMKYLLAAANAARQEDARRAANLASSPIRSLRASRSLTCYEKSWVDRLSRPPVVPPACNRRRGLHIQCRHRGDIPAPTREQSQATDPEVAQPGPQALRRRGVAADSPPPTTTLTNPLPLGVALVSAVALYKPPPRGLTYRRPQTWSRARCAARKPSRQLAAGAVTVSLVSGKAGHKDTTLDQQGRPITY